MRNPLGWLRGRLWPVRCCGDDVDDLVAARFQLLKDHGQGRLGAGLNVVQEQNAFAFGLKPRQRVVDHLCRGNVPPVIGGEVRAPGHEAALAQFGLKQIAAAQAGNPEERRKLRRIGESGGDVGDAVVDFGAHALRRKFAEEGRMIFAMRADGVPGIMDAAHVLREFLRHAPDQKERRLHALRGKRLKETPDMFSGLMWTGAQSIQLGLADAYGSVDSVARDVIKAEKVLDYSVKENIAERFAKRLGASTVAGFWKGLSESALGSRLY